MACWTWNGGQRQQQLDGAKAALNAAIDAATHDVELYSVQIADNTLVEMLRDVGFGSSPKSVEEFVLIFYCGSNDATRITPPHGCSPIALCHR